MTNGVTHSVRIARLLGPSLIAITITEDRRGWTSARPP
jgi:hypothetical protein